MRIADPFIDELTTEAETTRRILERVPDDQLSWRPHPRSWSGGQPTFAAPRVGVVRSLMLNHWYHHRGQLTVYLRELGVPVPAIYGPSADENPFAVAGSSVAAV